MPNMVRNHLRWKTSNMCKILVVTSVDVCSENVAERYVFADVSQTVANNPQGLWPNRLVPDHAQAATVSLSQQKGCLPQNTTSEVFLCGSLITAGVTSPGGNQDRWRPVGDRTADGEQSSQLYGGAPLCSALISCSGGACIGKKYSPGDSPPLPSDIPTTTIRLLKHKHRHLYSVGQKINKNSDKWTNIGVNVRILLGNNEDNFQLRRFVTSDNVESFFLIFNFFFFGGGATFWFTLYTPLFGGGKFPLYFSFFSLLFFLSCLLSPS